MSEKVKIEISKDLYEKLKGELEGSEIKEINSYEDFIGEKLFIRTITYHLVGKVKKIVGSMMFLENASRVADSGRFMNAIKEGVLNEVEPIGDWFVNIESIVDGGLWIHELPNKQK